VPYVLGTMPLDLDELLAPSHTAVLTMEVQRGVLGDLSMIPDLADEVRAEHVLEHIGEICRAARAAGARVVHCTAEFRADRAGSAANAPMLRASADGGHLVIGSPAVEIVPELDQQPSDLVVARVHGMTPFTGTSLDQQLRNCGITTVVATGASLNIGVFGMVVEAIGLGYRVVVPPDAVAGIPHDYGQLVLQHSIRPLAYLVPTEPIVITWSP
jgi:nicotinamidase-related amidase